MNVPRFRLYEGRKYLKRIVRGCSSDCRQNVRLLGKKVCEQLAAKKITGSRGPVEAHKPSWPALLIVQVPLPLRVHAPFGERALARGVSTAFQPRCLQSNDKRTDTNTPAGQHHIVRSSNERSVSRIDTRQPCLSPAFALQLPPPKARNAT